MKIHVSSLAVVMMGGCVLSTNGKPGSANSGASLAPASTPPENAPQEHVAPERASGGAPADEVVIPSVRNLSADQAKRKLRDAGITGPIDSSDFKPNDPYETACSTSPDAGQKTLGHLGIRIEPCDNDVDEPDGDDTPDLRGMTVEAATKVIRDYGYTKPVLVNPITSFRGPCTVDHICRVQPLHWAVAAAQIELFVLQGAK